MRQRHEELRREARVTCHPRHGAASSKAVEEARGFSEREGSSEHEHSHWQPHGSFEPLPERPGKAGVWQDGCDLNELTDVLDSGTLVEVRDEVTTIREGRSTILT